MTAKSAPRFRQLSNEERSLLKRCLTLAAFNGQRELLKQEPYAVVTSEKPLFLHLSVLAETAPSTHRSGPILIRAIAVNDAGEVEGLVLVWVSDGYLSALEYAWLSDERPEQFPTAAMVKLLPDPEKD